MSQFATFSTRVNTSKTATAHSAIYLFIVYTDSTKKIKNSGKGPVSVKGLYTCDYFYNFNRF